ncbi:hypothetical protein N7474_006975 [Penicillium riverlandense]|uniref:uncharacterized protein n=1 Tax=Penicillium riverlandense TaxID=1903569 RepID=UPI0025486DFE|nr:uncharacterized protein N7474_006975 [Penicillium riverlandense]KAJ5815198.1 hypothetical protein N7474_006975 [Penicillium riverlandense]
MRPWSILVCSPDLAFRTPSHRLGATTFRLRVAGLTIFHDTWLNRPSLLPQALNINDITDVDYILISHAHFDHLPGADVIAKRTDAIVIANGEAINRLRDAGVPETQLLPVAGGERVPLFTREMRLAAAAASPTIPLHQGNPPTAPAEPHHTLAVAEVHIWPSLHCLLPGSHKTLPDVFDTGVPYDGEATPFDGTLDVTRGMKYGLFRLRELVSVEAIAGDEKLRCFLEWLEDRGEGRNVMSACDGGQLMFHVLRRGGASAAGAGIWKGGILFNAHLGAYEGIMKTIRPRPNLVVQGIAGRANLNGRPFNGSAADFATELLRWVGEPERVIWCLHDEW